MADYQCLLCGQRVPFANVTAHKRQHADLSGYGIMWPPMSELKLSANSRRPVSTHASEFLAKEFDVRAVYVRDEGMNPSGSMKDYSVERAIRLGLAAGKNIFYVISSGNHAFSLCLHTRAQGCRAVVFAPGASSKIPFLTSFPDVLVVAVKGAIFEDVYNLVTTAALDDIPGLYNANVNNEQLLPAFGMIAHDILALDPRPTHILAGAGNGSYLAGIAYGFDAGDVYPMPKIVPVGMKGAFPTEDAHRRSARWHKYRQFQLPEHEINSIDAAEGSIATESYSMPQLMYALQLSNGFTLGGLTNADLIVAYKLLARDQAFVDAGTIPEATGIMALAAVIKWRACFRPSDVLHLSFTGQGSKDPDGLMKLLPEEAERLLAAAGQARPDLAPQHYERHPRARVIEVDKNIKPSDLRAVVWRHCALRS